ncbi:MAG: hypothetical protein AAF728_12775 [Cyanobacteria bacterium P01_D01_bin.128]
METPAVEDAGAVENEEIEDGEVEEALIPEVLVGEEPDSDNPAVEEPGSIDLADSIDLDINLEDGEETADAVVETSEASFSGPQADLNRLLFDNPSVPEEPSLSAMPDDGPDSRLDDGINSINEIPDSADASGEGLNPPGADSILGSVSDSAAVSTTADEEPEAAAGLFGDADPDFGRSASVPPPVEVIRSLAELTSDAAASGSTADTREPDRASALSSGDLLDALDTGLYSNTEILDNPDEQFVPAAPEEELLADSNESEGLPGSRLALDLGEDLLQALDDDLSELETTAISEDAAESVEAFPDELEAIAGTADPAQAEVSGQVEGMDDLFAALSEDDAEDDEPAGLTLQELIEEESADSPPLSDEAVPDTQGIDVTDHDRFENSSDEDSEPAEPVASEMSADDALLLDGPDGATETTAESDAANENLEGDIPALDDLFDAETAVAGEAAGESASAPLEDVLEDGTDSLSDDPVIPEDIMAEFSGDLDLPEDLPEDWPPEPNRLDLIPTQPDAAALLASLPDLTGPESAPPDSDPNVEAPLDSDGDGSAPLEKAIAADTETSDPDAVIEPDLDDIDLSLPELDELDLELPEDRPEDGPEDGPEDRAELPLPELDNVPLPGLGELPATVNPDGDVLSWGNTLDSDTLDVEGSATEALQEESATQALQEESATQALQEESATQALQEESATQALYGDAAAETAELRLNTAELSADAQRLPELADAIEPVAVEEVAAGEPPAPAPTADASSQDWYLSLDIGTTGLSAVLLDRVSDQTYPLYWQSHTDPETAERVFRLPIRFDWVPDGADAPNWRVQAVGLDATALAEPQPQGEETSQLAEEADSPSGMIPLKSLLKVAVPYRTANGQDCPTVQWSSRQQFSLWQVQRALAMLCSTLQSPERCVALGLEASQFQGAIADLSGLIVGYPHNWPDTFCFNVREAILSTGLVMQPAQIFFVEDAIAAVLSGLPNPATDGEEAAQTMAQQTIYGSNWRGGTAVISAGAAVTEMALVNLPAELSTLTYGDFALKAIAYAGDAIDQDIIGQLLLSGEARRGGPTPGDLPNLFNRAGANGWDWQPRSNNFTDEDWAALNLDPQTFPRPGEPEPFKRRQLQQALTGSLLGQSLLEAARYLKLILQHQGQFRLEIGDRRWTIRRRDLESKIFLPYIQRVNRQINLLLTQTGVAAQGINQVICTGGSASLPAFARWLRQKFPNATIVQDTYPSDRPASCSRVAYGLANLARYPRVVDLTRQQYSDYFLLKELLRSLPHPPLPLSGILHRLEQRGLNTQACQRHLIALLEGHLPPGMVPTESDRLWLNLSETEQALYHELTRQPLFSKQGGQTYVPNPQQAQKLGQYLDLLLADKQQQLEEPLTAQMGRVEG